jgi:hypothetical protein
MDFRTKARPSGGPEPKNGMPSAIALDGTERSCPSRWENGLRTVALTPDPMSFHYPWMFSCFNRGYGGGGYGDLHGSDHGFDSDGDEADDNAGASDRSATEGVDPSREDECDSSGLDAGEGDGGTVEEMESGAGQVDVGRRFSGR